MQVKLFVSCLTVRIFPSCETAMMVALRAMAGGAAAMALLMMS